MLWGYIVLFWIETAVVYWVVDASLKLDKFDKISPWLGPWNLTLASLFLLMPWSIIQNIARYDSQRQRSRILTKLLYVINGILVSGLFFCLILFYILIITKWSQIETWYKVFWFIVMAPINLVVLLQMIYGIIFIVIIIVENIKRKRRDSQNKIRKNIYSHIYNKRFAINKVKDLLTYEFFGEKLEQSELNLLKNEFSTVTNDKESCPICFEPFYKTLVTSVPKCNHKYHYECQKQWAANKSICPVDRNYLRLNMVQHYHSDFNPKFAEP